MKPKYFIAFIVFILSVSSISLAQEVTIPGYTFPDNQAIPESPVINNQNPVNNTQEITVQPNNSMSQSVTIPSSTSINNAKPTTIIVTPSSDGSPTTAVTMPSNAVSAPSDATNSTPSSDASASSDSTAEQPNATNNSCPNFLKDAATLAEVQNRLQPAYVISKKLSGTLYNLAGITFTMSNNGLHLSLETIAPDNPLKEKLLNAKTISEAQQIVGQKAYIFGNTFMFVDAGKATDPTAKTKYTVSTNLAGNVIAVEVNGKLCPR